MPHVIFGTYLVFVFLFAKSGNAKQRELNFESFIVKLFLWHHQGLLLDPALCEWHFVSDGLYHNFPNLSSPVPRKVL